MVAEHYVRDLVKLFRGLHIYYSDSHLPHHRILAADRVAVDFLTLGKSALAADDHGGGLIGLVSREAHPVLFGGANRGGYGRVGRVDGRGFAEESVSNDHCVLPFVFHVPIVADYTDVVKYKTRAA